MLTKSRSLINSLLFNYVLHRIYLYIEDSTTYEDAKQVLDRIYLKPKNEIFARHLLMITKQKSNESLAEFARTLRERSKDCNFQAVTAEQHRDKMMRDAFIGGLYNSSNRQRLLEEKEELHFQGALTKYLSDQRIFPFQLKTLKEYVPIIEFTPN